MEGVRIVMVSGAEYMFTARPDTAEVSVHTSSAGHISVRRGGQWLGTFPSQNVEAILPVTEIDEVAP